MNRLTLTFAITLIATSISTAELIGTFPVGGGKMIVEPTRDAIQTFGLEFAAEPGILTQGDSAEPFAFFLPNIARPGYITFGALGIPVTIDGPIELDMTVSASATGADINATWGKGVVPTPFPINGILNGNGQLKGSFAYDGGPISISPAGDQPITTRGLSLRTNDGLFTAGGSSAPFETLTENTAKQWSVSSSADVIIDGLVTFDVSASSSGNFFGNTVDPDGNSNGSFRLLRESPAFSSALEGSYTGNGPISIRPIGEPLNLRGLEIRSAFGLRGGSSAAPFESLDENSGSLWKVSSSTNVLIDGPLVLDVRTTGVRGVGGLFTDGTTSSDFAISQRTGQQEIREVHPNLLRIK